MRSILVLALLSLVVGCADAKNLAKAAGADVPKDLKEAEKVAAEEGKKAADDAPKNIYQTAAYKGMGQLTAALSKVGLDKVLETPGPFTVFAPSDEAFNKLAPEARAILMSDAGKDKLIAILKYHVVAGNHPASELSKLKTTKTVNGADVAIAVGKDGKVTVGGANVTTADVAATNGVIHVVDTVMMPPGA